jgi:Histidine kinase-, DNA gyrase B-, and HSP90-like ATPase
MLPRLVQPTLIAPTMSGLVGLWHGGVSATHVNMTYATYAVDAGMSLADYLKISHAQLKLLECIRKENACLKMLPPTDPRLEQLRARFAHDCLDNLYGALRATFVHANISPSKLQRFFEVWRSTYRLSPNLRQLVTGILEQQTLRIADKTVDILVGLPSSWTLHASLHADARVLFENLIRNMVKYSKPEAVTIEVFEVGRPPRGIVFADRGVGMDQAFAARLGGEEELREGRAEGVPGEGIGWTTIGRICRAHGWRWEIETAPGAGTKVTIHFNEGDLVPIDATQPEQDLRLPPDDLIPASFFVEGARVFADAQPFAGYRLVEADGMKMLDVSASPIAQAVVRAQTVRDSLEKHRFHAEASQARDEA